MNIPFAKFRRHFRLFGLLLCLALSATACKPAATDTTPPKLSVRPPDASDTFFAGPIVHIHLAVAESDAEKINQEGRPYVPCTLVEKDAAGNTLAEYPEVAIKLKGAAGSFQTFEGKPALTVRVDKLKPGRLFHNLAKLHLNNSVQDETYLHEQICSELFLEANVPAARVTHARVTINDRDLGLYVLKEGFDPRFLARHFSHAEGNMYDGGFCTDIDVDLEKDAGRGPDDRSDLIALREACTTEDPVRRIELLEQNVDIDPFLTFVALELMTCHWDGYACNANNYRVYFDPATKRARFFPHGMDQMFGDPGFSVVSIPRAHVARLVMEHPPWRDAFKSRMNALLPNFSPPDKLLARIDALNARLRPVIAAYDPPFADHHDELVKELKARIVARAENLEEQKSFPDPRPVEFSEEGIFELASVDWYPASEVEDALLEEVEVGPDQRARKIACGPSGRCIASWRTTLLLAQGKYLFTAQVTTLGVQGITDDKGTGAGLRISGATRENHAVGTRERQELKYEFTIEEESRQVELIAELRAEKGEALFASDSLRMHREALPDPKPESSP